MNTLAKKRIVDYKELLQEFGLECFEEGYYYRVGLPDISEGWILHLSVIPAQMARLIDLVIPILLQFNLRFKIVRNEAVHIKLNEGEFGWSRVGKVVTIYLENEAIIIAIISSLFQVMKEFRGPQVLTDFSLSNNLYVRWGAFHLIPGMDQVGNLDRIIRDNAGNIKVDTYVDFPVLPKEYDHPLVEYIQREIYFRVGSIISRKYLLVKLLKADIKGNVWLAIFLRKRWVPSLCVLKEGKKGMLPDVYGRDMRDRITWQAKLGKELWEYLPIPTVYDCFEEGDKMFVVSRYIKGESLFEVLNGIIRRRPWFCLATKEKIKVLDLLIEISASIRELNRLGFVHRDVAYNNFTYSVITNRLYLIDLELVFNVIRLEPEHPFLLGTFGYMSPQQRRMEEPNFSDDVYAFAMLVFITFWGTTNPAFLNDGSIDSLKAKLNLVIRDESFKIGELILRCLSDDVADRPGINEVHAILTDYRTSVKAEKLQYSTAPDSISIDIIRNTIMTGLENFSTELVASNHVWFSKVDKMPDGELYPLFDRHTYFGLYRGIAGVLYLLATAKECRFDLSCLNESISASYQYLINQVFPFIENFSASYYLGVSGMATGIIAASGVDLIDLDVSLTSTLKRCITKENEYLPVSHGIAGQGLAMIETMSFFGKKFLEPTLERIATRLIGGQQLDGSWVTGQYFGKEEKINGFSDGAAGIAYFLLEYGSRFSNRAAVQSAAKALQYLRRHAQQVNESVNWPQSNRNRVTSNWMANGGPGISLAFLKSFEISGNKSDLAIAESALRANPRYLAHLDLSQAYGISGLGELYLEAFRITGADEWYDRAQWLVSLLVTTRFQTEVGAYWPTGIDIRPTADLMVGNGGILHFLVRFLYPDKVGFPLLPKN